MLTAEKQTDSKSGVEYATTFALAKEALTYIGTFKTPPTPEVYEVWYRFVEGGNEAINEQLRHAVNVAKSVSKTQLEHLKQQFLNEADGTTANELISESLSVQMEGLQKLLSSQLGANGEFGESLENASSTLGETVVPDEIQSCLRTVLRKSESMQQRLASMDAKLVESRSQIEGLREGLTESQKAMLTDPLTGIGNRRFFDTIMSKAFADSRERKAIQFLMLVDLDNFKDVNDTYGHAVGDAVLRFAAKKMQGLAADASFARYGGDEFAVFVNVDSADSVQTLANCFCEYFSSNTIVVEKTGERVSGLSVSIGAALLRSEDTRDSWFERADKLLYSAKNGGRNRASIERNFIG